MAFRRFARQLAASLILMFGLMLSLTPSASAQRAMPDAAPLANFNPLCDSSLVHCLEIDRFAGHVYGHLQVLPKTERRDTAAVFPIGVTLGLFGRVAGGISASYAFWKEADATFQQLSPLRLSLAARLLPLLDSSDEVLTDEPSRNLQLGIVYEQEVRVGSFSGTNSLGLLTDLASLQLVSSKWLGPLQLAVNVGALFDWRGAFATGTAAAQLGLLIPGFRQLKVFGEATARGFGAYVKTDALPLISASSEPIRPQGTVGAGLAFRAHRRVDLDVEVQRGFGFNIAPWSIGISLIVISAGKEHEGHSVTPLAQLAADVTREFVSWTVQKIQTIDPYLKKDCVLYDDNHQPMTKLGELSPDEAACIYQGLRVPIGPHFWKNQGETRVCYDKAATDCFLIRPDRDARWEPVYPLLVHSDCYAYLNGQPWMRVGQLSADKQRCENQGQAIAIGQTLRPDYRVPGSWYCYDEAEADNPRQRHRWCVERPDRPISDIGYAGRQGIAHGTTNLRDIGSTTKQVIQEASEGTPLHATTPVKEAEAAGRSILDAVKDAKPEDAERVYEGVLGAAKSWWDKPLREKVADAAEAGADAATDPLTYVPGASLLGKGSKLAAESIKAVEAGEHAAKKAAKASKALKRAEHVEQAAVGATRVEKAGLYSHLPEHASVGPSKDFTRAQKKKILEENMKKGGGQLQSDGSGDTLVWPKKHVKGKSPPVNEAHVDHRTPKVRGGENSFQNAQVLSREENLKKGTR